MRRPVILDPHRPWPLAYPDMTDAELRAGLDLPPTWALAQKGVVSS